MHPYLFTLSFLLLMSLLTSSEVSRFSKQGVEKSCYLRSQRLYTATEEVRELSHCQELQSQEGGEERREQEKREEVPLRQASSYVRHARALGVCAARPPNNSRLNLYTLLYKDQNPREPKEFSLYEVVAALMRLLYQKEPFFQEYKGIEYAILDRLIEKKEVASHFTTPDQLSSVDLEDGHLQQVFYHMLIGTHQAPSLLHYLTFDPLEAQERGQMRKINLLFVDPLVLQAIFPTGRTAHTLAVQRDLIWEEITYQEQHRLQIVAEIAKGRRQYAEAIRRMLEQVLAEEGIKGDKYRQQIFDCTLGTPGTVLFLEDPLTGYLVREIYHPPQPERVSRPLAGRDSDGMQKK